MDVAAYRPRQKTCIILSLYNFFFFWITQKIILFDTEIAHKAGGQKKNMHKLKCDESLINFKMQERKVSPPSGLLIIKSYLQSLRLLQYFNPLCKKPVSETQVHQVHSVEAALMRHHLI